MTSAARRLRAALAAVLVQAEEPELALVHRWLDSIAHWILGGSAWEPTVWRAVQLAGWDALKHAERAL